MLSLAIAESRAHNSVTWDGNSGKEASKNQAGSLYLMQCRGKWQKAQNNSRNESRVGKQLSWQGWPVVDVKLEPTEDVEAVNVALARLIWGNMGMPRSKSKV